MLSKLRWKKGDMGVICAHVVRSQVLAEALDSNIRTKMPNAKANQENRSYDFAHQVSNLIQCRPDSTIARCFSTEDSIFNIYH